MSISVVGNNNFNDSAFYNAFSYSSQKTVAPASNLDNQSRRSKVWRSSGYWEVTNSNKGIVLQEVNTVNQTVNIATGNYTSDTTFFAAVKAALDGAAGSAVYTVARDTTTNKIKITSDAGGGAILKLMTSNASFTSATSLGFSTSGDLSGSLTYTADALKLHSYEYLKWDLGSAFNPKAFIIFGLRNTPIKISETATITLEGNASDAWTSPSYSQVLTYNARAIAVIDTDGLHTSALRYWRLKIVDQLNTYGYVEISNVYFGDAFDSAQGGIRFPLRSRLVDLSKISYGRSGNPFSDKIQTTKEIDINWELLGVADKESLSTFVEDVGTNKSFFIAFDPNGVFSSDFQNEIYLARFTSPPSFDLTRPGLFSSSWNIREEL